MAIFYLDENISQRLVPFLNVAGHVAITARGQFAERTPDDAHLFLCRQRRWFLVTHNGRHFQLMHDTLHRWARAWGAMDLPAGILVTPDGLGTREEASLLDIFAACELPTADMLYAWTPHGAWVRCDLRGM